MPESFCAQGRPLSAGVGPHAIFEALAAPCRLAQAPLAPVVLPSLWPELLVLLDRGLFAGPLIEGLRQMQTQVIVGLQSQVLTKPVSRLGDGSSLAYFWPQSCQGLRKRLVLGVITCCLDAPDLPWGERPAGYQLA